MISNCGHDEHNQYRNGKAGDQTGGEWARIPWYNRPWTCVLRWPDKRVAEDIAYCAGAAADNDMIGYDQSQRATFWDALAGAMNYDPAKITTTCESDCTCGVATCVKAAGLRQGVKVLASIDPDYYYSGNMRSGFRALGFKVLTDSKYLTSDRYLLPGDILLYENHHAATNLDIGDLVRDEWEPVPTYTIGWHRDDSGWWFADTSHSYLKSEWEKINGCWYYFDERGYAVTGPQYIKDKNGAFQWYFFEPEIGHPKECALMATDESGALQVWIS